jgi:para-nitrobenzyl esterase
MNVVVKTRQGDVRGIVSDGVNAFKGIPYAAAPTGAHRLRPPQPRERWDGVRNAFSFGPKSSQPEYPAEVRLLLPELSGPGEDCLTLNVWTAELGGAGQPVMVWIAGGLYEYHGTGASPWYDGSRFARDGVVCVTINYRVGADGFLFLDDGIANVGLLDQLAALTWVHENITGFGGDPGNVTIFGESAGALSVGTLLSMPRAVGMFRRAIAQSGAAHHVQSAASALHVGRALARRLGVPATRDAIAALPVERVLAAQAELRDEIAVNPDPAVWGDEVVSTMLPWQPAIDGSVTPGRPIDRVAAGAGADVDLIVGTNVDEHRLFLVAGGMIEHVPEEAVAGALAGYRLPVEPALAAYRTAYPGASAGDLLAVIQTDWYWRIPSIRLADAHATREARTYMYEFAWRSPQFGGLLGACHALEIPFVFDTLGCETEALWGGAPPQQLADEVHAAWVAFAKSGDCGWPEYDVNRRMTMRFDAPSACVDDPRLLERNVWQGVR